MFKILSVLEILLKMLLMFLWFVDVLISRSTD
jgi:hypothetical protein